MQTTSPSGDVESDAVEAPRPGEEPADAAETQMRRALGLASDKPTRDGAPPESTRRLSLRPRSSDALPSGRPARRFVQDGDVPVTVVRGRWAQGPGSQEPVINRLAIAEAAAETERSKSERLERSLRDSLETIRDLQTKQAHIELARDEAVQALKGSAAALESLHTALRSHQEQLALMQAAVKASDRAVRAGSTALSAGRTARAASETAPQEAVSTRRSPKKPTKRTRSAPRSSEKPARRRSAGSSARGENAKPANKTTRTRKMARKANSAPEKAKRRRSALPKKPATAVRKNGRRIVKRRG